jgi:hypothetical protein
MVEITSFSLIQPVYGFQSLCLSPDYVAENEVIILEIYQFNEFLFTSFLIDDGKFERNRWLGVAYEALGV